MHTYVHVRARVLSLPELHLNGNIGCYSSRLSSEVGLHHRRAPSACVLKGFSTAKYSRFVIITLESGEKEDLGRIFRGRGRGGDGGCGKGRRVLVVGGGEGGREGG